MIAKIHKRGEDVVLALCDEDIIGKIFEEKDLILDLTSNFYKGEIVDENKILHMIKRIYIINAVGKKTINFLQEHGLIEAGHVRTVENIPFTNVVILNS